jgi:hypothetical protein
LFYTKPDLSTAGLYQPPEPNGTASDWDVLSSSYKSAVESNSFLSGESNLRSVYDDHNKTVKKLTGEELANPQFDLRMDPFQGSNQDRAAYWKEYNQHRSEGGQMGQKDFMDRWIEKNYRRQLEEIAAKYPELRGQLLPDLEFKQQAYQRAADAEKKEQEIWQKSNKGIGSYAAWIAGGLGAAAVDPVNWLTAPIGWGKAINGARGLALAFAKGGAANALAEGIIQFTPGGVQDYRYEAGLYSGVGPGLEAMGGAFLFGGALDAGGRALTRGTRYGLNYEPVLKGNEIIGWQKRGAVAELAPAVPSTPLPRADIPDELRQRAAAGDTGAQAEIMARVQEAELAKPKDDSFIPIELAKRADEGDPAAIREVAKKTGQDQDPVTRRALDEMDINESLVEPPDPSITPAQHVKAVDQAMRHVMDPINEPPPVVRAGRTAEDILDLEDEISTLQARYDMDGLGADDLRKLEDMQAQHMALRLEIMSADLIDAVDSGVVSRDVANVVLDHVENKAIQSRVAADLMEREVATAEQARRELAEIVTSPDYRNAPIDDGAKQLDDPYGPDAVRQIENLERQQAEELGLDPKDLSKTEEVKPRETQIKEAIDRADAVKAAIDDLADIIPEEVTVRVFSGIDQLPVSIRGQVANANARLFADALDQYQAATTVRQRDIARANLDAAKRGLGIEGIADGHEIWIASYAMNPAGRVAHEVVHALRQLGKIAPDELKALAERAARDGHFTAEKARLYRAELEARGYDAATVADRISEEAAAHMIDARVKSGEMVPDARVETILTRVMDFFSSVRSRLRGEKFMTAAERADAGNTASNDAIRAFMTGEMARREANGDWSRKAPDYRKDVVNLRAKIGKLETELQATLDVAEVRFRDPETGEPMRDSDVNAFVDTWKFVKSMRTKKGPKTLTQFVVDRGGVYDGTGDVMQLLGDYKARPGLINKVGQDLDDLAMAAWEAGYVTTQDRATISEFLEALQDDLGGYPVYRAADAEYADQLRLAQEMENDLAEAGIRDAKSATAIRKHFAGEGEGSAGGRSADTIRAEIEKARTELEAAQRTASDAAMYAIRNHDREPVTPGLDMSQAARLQRAREMGFDTDTPSYHVTDQDFNQFDLNKLGKNTDLDPDTWAGRLSGIGVWSSDGPKKVASAMGMDNYDGTRTLPIFRKGDYVEFPDYGLDDLSSHIKDLGGAKKFVEEMKSQGYSGVKVKDDEFGVTSYVSFDPSNIRSVNAAFDPAKADSPNLMFAIGGNRTAQDEFGFYSKALEAARGLKQSKGTPEQMLSQLIKAGVKKAEIEATGLDKLLADEGTPRVASSKRPVIAPSSETVPAYVDAVIQTLKGRGWKLATRSQSGLSSSTYLAFVKADGSALALSKKGRSIWLSEFKAGGAPADGRFNVRVADHSNRGGATTPQSEVRIGSSLDDMASRADRLLELEQEYPSGGVPSETTSRLAITKAEIIEHLELSRVKVMEGRYQRDDQSVRIGEEVDRRMAEWKDAQLEQYRFEEHSSLDDRLVEAHEEALTDLATKNGVKLADNDDSVLSLMGGDWKLSSGDIPAFASHESYLLVEMQDGTTHLFSPDTADVFPSRQSAIDDLEDSVASNSDPFAEEFFCTTGRPDGC